MGKKIILVGKAGSGKDFFRDFLSSKGEKIDVSYTSRPPREGEEGGYTYNYISKLDFIIMDRKGEFFESVEFNTWKYGTHIDSWKNNKIFIMTPSGIKHIPEEQLRDCLIVYFDISERVRRDRLSKRFDSDSVERRIGSDEKDFSNFLNFNLRITNSLFSCSSLNSIIQKLEKL